MRKLITLYCLIASCHNVFADLPEKAIPFILDSHVYIQGVVADTIPISLIDDTGADRLYLDKDYMDLSSLGKLPYRKATARMGAPVTTGLRRFP